MYGEWKSVKPLLADFGAAYFAKTAGIIIELALGFHQQRELLLTDVYELYPEGLHQVHKGKIPGIQRVVEVRTVTLTELFHQLRVQSAPQPYPLRLQNPVQIVLSILS